LQYSAEGETGLETAGGIKKALPLLGTEPFLVVNGDVLTDINFAALKHNLAPTMQAHLVLVPNPPQHPAGDFGFDVATALVTSHSAEQFTFSGIALYRPEFFAAVPDGKQKLAPFLRQVMVQQLVSGELHTGFWADIGTPERLVAADQQFCQQEDS
jgi:MurNAc alpha-1-phosphate uridylyltransferase